MKITSENSRSALFGISGPEAIIRNVKVEGNISPSGEQSCIGGIVGENMGTVDNCSFSGLISGSKQVGGIAGINAAGGVISECKAAGIVRGKQLTGGISGENTGSIIRSENTAAVNTTVTEEDITTAELAELDSTIYDLLKKRDGNYEISVTSDTGGITGYSVGVIQSCENSGAVGYRHVGYNVGGIAGRQSGYISNCRNTGKILGRKDVGGIVGQMVPDITVQHSADGLGELQNELKQLQTMIDNALQDTESAANAVSDNLNVISEYAKSAGDMTTQLTSFVNSNINSVNGLLLMVERYISRLAPIAEDLADSVKNLNSTVTEIRRLLEILNGTTEYNDRFLRELKNFCVEASAASKDMSEGLNALNRAFALLQNAAKNPDTKKLSDDITALANTAAKLAETTDKAIEELQTNGTVSSETGAALAKEIRSLLSCGAAVCRDAADLIKNTDLSDLRNQTVDTLRNFAAEMQTAVSYFSSSASHFGKAFDFLGKAVDELRGINTILNDAYAQADKVFNETQKSLLSLKSALEKTAALLRELEREEPITFVPLSREFSSSSEALNSSINGIGNGLSELEMNVSGATGKLISDIRGISGQFSKVMLMFINLIQEVQNTDYTDIFEDASDNSILNSVRGKVRESENSGEIFADRNGGEIAGAMAIEYDLDPEDDLLSENRSGKLTYQTRAVLLDCKNFGSVTAKRSCVGGVVGRADIGTVYGCIGLGNISSDSGEYAGGVCGFSLSSVKKSFAKCTVSGN